MPSFLHEKLEEGRRDKAPVSYGRLLLSFVDVHGLGPLHPITNVIKSIGLVHTQELLARCTSCRHGHSRQYPVGAEFYRDSYSEQQLDGGVLLCALRAAHRVHVVGSLPAWRIFKFLMIHTVGMPLTPQLKPSRFFDLT